MQVIKFNFSDTTGKSTWIKYDMFTQIFRFFCDCGAGTLNSKCGLVQAGQGDDLECQPPGKSDLPSSTTS